MKLVLSLDRKKKKWQQNFDQQSIHSLPDLVNQVKGKMQVWSVDHLSNPFFRIQIVLATNQIRQLDSAVLDRMNELVEVPLPQFDDREAIISQYMLSHVIKPATDKTSRVVLGEDLSAVLAEITEGMSGREMGKMCSNISVRYYIFKGSSRSFATKNTEKS